MGDKVVYNGIMQEVKTCECTLNNGQTFMIKSLLTHDEQITCAMEYAREMCIIDDEKKVAYQSYDERYACAIAYCGAYTNLDVESVISHSGSTKIIDEIIGAVEKYTEDYVATYTMMRDYMRTTLEIYRQYNSLSNKMSVGLGGLLDNGDVIKAFVENPDVNNKMIEIINKARMFDEGKVAPFAWAKKKN